MDEAVLRIVLQDAAKGSTPTSQAGTPAPAPQPSQSQQDAAADPHFAGARSSHRMKEYAREIVEGAQENLAKYQADYIANLPEVEPAGKYDYIANLPEVEPAGSGKGLAETFKSMSSAVESLLKGDIGGAFKHGGESLEAAGISTGAVAEVVPVVGAVLAAKAVSDYITGAAIGGIKSTIGGAGSVAASIASVNDDVTKPIAQVGDVVSGLGEKIAYVEPVIGLLGVAAGESAKALSTLMQAIDATAKHYEQFSVDVSMASAQAEIRQTMGDLRRAKELGGGLGQYVTAKSKLEDDVEDIKAKLLGTLLPLVITAVESMGTLVKLTTVLVPSSETASKAMKLLFPTAAAIKLALDEINKSMDKEHQVEDPTTALFRLGAIAAPPEMEGR